MKWFNNLRTHKMITWIKSLFKRKEKGAPTPIESPEAIIALILPLIAQAIRANHGSLPTNLNDLIPVVHAALPEHFRHDDSVPNQADFAPIVHNAALLVYRCEQWLKMPW